MLSGPRVATTEPRIMAKAGNSLNSGTQVSGFKSQLLPCDFYDLGHGLCLSGLDSPACRMGVVKTHACALKGVAR